MGNLEHIEQLEEYINDLGDEIKRVKKASEYIALIEEFQDEIALATSTLEQSRDQLKIYQNIVESKLDLFQSSSKTIETKQQILEQNQSKIIDSMGQLKQQQKNLNLKQDEQKSELIALAGTNKKYFITNLIISLPILGILVYLLIK